MFFRRIKSLPPLAALLLLVVAGSPATGAGLYQEAFVKAANPDISDWFGFSAAFSGNTLVVGAPQEDSNASGVNGNLNDESESAAGAAYVFSRTGATWSLQRTLRASNAELLDGFGTSVAVAGGIVAVGAPGEDGVNNGSGGSGAVYLFDGGFETALLKGSNTVSGDAFGFTVAFSGSLLAVGAPNQANTGAVYVFGGGGRSQEAFLKASNAGFFDEFGYSVAISGDTVVVGARGERSDATGVNGDQGDSSAGSASGAAYVFQRAGKSWIQTAYLKASNTGGNDSFGSSITISGDTIVAGAIGDESHSKLIDGNQGDQLPAGNNSGAVYVFTGLFERFGR